MPTTTLDGTSDSPSAIRPAVRALLSSVQASLESDDHRAWERAAADLIAAKSLICRALRGFEDMAALHALKQRADELGVSLPDLAARLKQVS